MKFNGFLLLDFNEIISSFYPQFVIHSSKIYHSSNLTEEHYSYIGSLNLELPNVLYFGIQKIQLQTRQKNSVLKFTVFYVSAF